MTTATPTTVEEFAAGVANDIRTHGHFQEKAGQHLDTAVDTGWDGQCCVMVNPTSREAFRGGYTIGLGFIDGAFLSRVRKHPQGPGNMSVSRWSNTTPTEEVLAVLDDIAAGN